MSMLLKYQEQFTRLNRWYERFKVINDGKIHDEPSDFYQDNVYAFFMNCYHLKDWIKNDPSVASVVDNIEAYINNNPALSLCADICNGLKHLRLDSARSGESPKFGPRLYKVELGTKPTTITIKYTINTSSGPIDAFELATKCMKAWKNFIVSIT